MRTLSKTKSPYLKSGESYRKTNLQFEKSTLEKDNWKDFDSSLYDIFSSEKTLELG